MGVEPFLRGDPNPEVPDPVNVHGGHVYDALTTNSVISRLVDLSMMSRYHESGTFSTFYISPELRRPLHADEFSYHLGSITVPDLPEIKSKMINKRPVGALFTARSIHTDPHDEVDGLLLPSKEDLLALGQLVPYRVVLRSAFYRETEGLVLSHSGEEITEDVAESVAGFHDGARSTEELDRFFEENGFQVIRFRIDLVSLVIEEMPTRAEFESGLAGATIPIAIPKLI